MRMRRKPYARPELAVCLFNVDEPAQFKGMWKQQFKNSDNPLQMELGIGKGGFLSQLAHEHKDVNYIGIDIKSEMLVVAKRKIEAIYVDEPIDNVKIMSLDIERLFTAFSHEDRISRIYINFCNPWYKTGDKKHRLTYPRQLKMYAQLMTADAQLRFKTDDDGLYVDSLRYFKDEGWRIIFESDDFAQKPMPDNIPTEHELMFMREGKKIKGLIALPPESGVSCETIEDEPSKE